MIRKLAVAAGLIAVSARATIAQSCSISSTAVTPPPCTVTSTATLTVPSLLSLTMSGFTSGTAQTLNAPTAMTDFSSGNTIQIATTGPAFVVKSTSAADVDAGAATTGSTSVGVFYKTTYNFTADVPGTYNLDVKFTLVAP